MMFHLLTLAVVATAAVASDEAANKLLNVGDVCQTGGVTSGGFKDLSFLCPKGTTCEARFGEFAIGGEVDKYCTPAAEEPKCLALGKEYAVGESYFDGCNNCRCLKGGRGACTRKACPRPIEELKVGEVVPFGHRKLRFTPPAWQTL